VSIDAPLTRDPARRAYDDRSTTRSSPPPRPSLSPRFVRLFGVFALVWAIAWIWLGVWTRQELHTLGRLGDTVATSGTAVQRTGNALQGLGRLPFVGGEVAGIGRQVSAAGADARRSGHSSTSAIGRLATLLGVAIALAPTVPMLVLWLVARRLVRRPERG
jgi:hypothetical protein